MADAFKAIYKCRLCGEVYTSLIMNGKGAVIASAYRSLESLRGTLPAGVPFVAMNDLHICNDCSVGISDFAGWKHE